MLLEQIHDPSDVRKLNDEHQVDGRFVSARFYMEIESHPARSAFQNAFDELRFFADELHMLGTKSRTGRETQSRTGSSSAS